MKHRKKRQKRSLLPCFVLSPAAVATAQNAMQCYERVLQRADGPSASMALAEAVMRRVNSKLNRLQTSGRELALAPFDSNEKLVLDAALQLYRLDLLAEDQTEQQAQELAHCQHWERLTRSHLQREREGRG